MPMTTDRVGPLSYKQSFGKRIAVPALLVGAGLAAIAFAALPVAKPPAEVPYTTKVTAVPVAEMKGTERPPEDVGKIDKLELNVPGSHQPVAQALIAREADGRAVALNWQNNVTEPVLAADLTTAEVEKVTKAIHDHVPADAPVLSWWDHSRKIRLVSQRNALLDDPLARGLLVPAAWAVERPMIESKERAYWGEAVPAQDGDAFSKFIDALLLDEEKGAASLAALAPGKTTYVVVHLSDIWKLAMERPESLSIASKDFPGSASHGVMKTVTRWLRDQKLDASYAVEPMGNAVRVHYLSNPADADRLIAKMLPFTSSNPVQLTHLKLVFQHRGFWIYRLDAGQPASG